MAGWILLTVLPVFMGVFLAHRARPANMGKKRALKAFTIAYPQKVVTCVVGTALAMVGVIALTWYKAPEVVEVCSVYYVIYGVLVGLVMMLAMLLGRRAISFNGEKIEVTTKLFGKPAVYSTSELAGLDIQKTAVRALREDGSVIFTAGVMMENLDLFFAWTHERPNIKLTMNGKELPKKGTAPKNPDRKPN